MPALKFHFADQLPVYTTSQSKRGSYENPRVKSAELPLNLQETHVNSSGFASWSSLSDNNEVDFFALGQSAFEIAGWAPLLYRDQKWRESFLRQLSYRGYKSMTLAACLEQSQCSRNYAGARLLIKVL